jgi:putative dimethyl sulfoxide reductase chaperone
MILNTTEKKPEVIKGYNMLLYFAGTMIMFDPSHECINDFWNQGILKTLPVRSQNPRFIKAASLLRQSVDNQDTSVAKMKEDYLSLFTGAGSPLAPPYESVYRSREHLMFDKQTSEVREFYRSYGWESKFKGVIPDDHLGIELLFLTILLEKYIELEDYACEAELKNEISRFIEDHILSWVPQWNEDIIKNGRTIGYQGISTLIYACVEDILGLMKKDKNIKSIRSSDLRN